jgi:hypothetical protein
MVGRALGRARNQPAAIAYDHSYQRQAKLDVKVETPILNPLIGFAARREC